MGGSGSVFPENVGCGFGLNIKKVHNLNKLGRIRSEFREWVDPGPYLENGWIRVRISEMFRIRIRFEQQSSKSQ